MLQAPRARPGMTAIERENFDLRVELAEEQVTTCPLTSLGVRRHRAGLAVAFSGRRCPSHISIAFRHPLLWRHTHHQRMTHATVQW